MGALDFSGLPPQALLLVDSAPIIYVLDRHAELGPRFRPLFEAQEADTVRFAITSVTIIEVLTGALAAGDQVQARRYRKVFESWTVVGLDQAIAERAAEWRTTVAPAPSPNSTAVARSVQSMMLVSFSEATTRIVFACSVAISPSATLSP